jgi:MFS family permease
MGSFLPQIAAPRPTMVRHGVLVLLTVMAVLLYLDRFCISIAVEQIGREFDLKDEQKAWILGIFFLAYGVGQVPGGWLGDRLGARVMLLGSVLAWSLFTALTGLVHGMTMLIVLRVLFGLSQAGAYPIAARSNSLWIPFSRRALTSSVIALGGRAGGALAPWATALLITRWGDWRPVFWLYAFLGVAWSAFFWNGFRNSPSAHPRCNAAERNLIAQQLPQAAVDPTGMARGIPWGAMLLSRSLWLQCLLQITGNAAWTFLVTWLPTYYMRVYKLHLNEAGFLSSLPLLAGMAGCLLGGMATDSLTRRLGMRWGRVVLGLASKLVAAAGALACMAARNAEAATLALILMSFATDAGMGATWAYFQDAGGPYAGTMLGWANMFGNVGSFLSPLLLGYLAQQLGWQAALGTCASLFLVAGICWLGVDPRQPLVRSQGSGISNS